MKTSRKIYTLLLAACLAAILVPAMATAAFADGECTHANKVSYQYKPATCTEPGMKGYSYCPDCNRYDYIENMGWVPLNEEQAAAALTIPAHSGEIVEYHRAVAATCTQTGNVEYQYCTVCKKYRVGDEEEWKTLDADGVAGLTLAINPTAHPAASQQSTPAASATCTKTGYAAAFVTCTDCGKINIGKSAEWVEPNSQAFKDNILPVNAANHPEGRVSIIFGVTPDCHNTGKTAHQKCEDCGKYKVGDAEWATLTDAQVAALTLAKDPENHAADMRRDVAVKDADCSGGVKTPHLVCDGCGKVSTDSGSTWSDLTGALKAELYLPSVHPNAEEHAAVAPADCRTAGNKAYSSCPDCGKVKFEGSGDAFDGWVSTSSEGGMDYVVLGNHDYSVTSGATYNGNHTHTIPCKYSTADVPHTAKTEGCWDRNADNLCDVCGSVINTTGGSGSGSGSGGIGTDPVFGVEYKMKEGSGSSWVNNSSTGLKFVSEADFDKFDHVEVDNQTIASQNYTAVSGSTAVTLKADYLKTLAVGKHTIKIVSKDGIARGEFTIKQGSPTVKTADESNMVLWVGIVAAAAATMGAVVIVDKKKHGV